MKIARLIAVLALIGGVGAALLIWQGCWQTANAAIQWDTSGTMPVGTNGHKFKVLQQLPDFPTLDQIRGCSKAPSWWVFFYLGDGRFWQGSLDDFENQIFYYPNQGTYNAYADLIPLYDDKKRPTYTTAFAPITINSSNNSSDPGCIVPMAADEFVKLTGSCYPQPNDTVTYVITYSSPKECTASPSITYPVSGNLTFQFDTDVLALSRWQPTNASEESIDSSQLSSGLITIHFNNLARFEQQNVFLRFRVKPGVTTATVIDQDPTVSYVLTSGGTCTDTDQINGETVVDSHDPNRKVAHESVPCDTDNFATFTITFQNDGVGPTQFVTVKDILDTYFEQDTPIIVDYVTPNSQKWPEQKLVGNQVVTTFDPLILNGLNQSGFGTEFTEEDTKASFTVKYKIKNDSINSNRCNAAVNRAEIIFDCNPPMFTNDALLPFRCDSCGVCASTGDTTIIASADTVGTALLNSNLLSNLTGLNNLHWYPSTGLLKPWYPNPKLKSAKIRKYTLVASTECKRSVYTVLLPERQCNLALTIDDSGVQGNCYDQLSGNIVATVTGGSDPDSILWNDCTTGYTNSISVKNGHLEYHIALTDLITGCSIDTVFALNRPGPIRIDDVPSDCDADLLITGGTPPYTANWNYQPSGSQQYVQATGLSLDISDKTNVSVTVTDANGCTAVFSPIKANPCPFDFWDYWYYYLAALAVVGIIGVAFLKFKKK